MPKLDHFGTFSGKIKFSKFVSRAEGRGTTEYWGERGSQLLNMTSLENHTVHFSDSFLGRYKTMMISAVGLVFINVILTIGCVESIGGYYTHYMITQTGVMFNQIFQGAFFGVILAFTCDQFNTDFAKLGRNLGFYVMFLFDKIAEYVVLKNKVTPNGNNFLRNVAIARILVFALIVGLVLIGQRLFIHRAVVPGAVTTIIKYYWSKVKNHRVKR